METILNTLIAVMLSRVNTTTDFATTTLGEYYKVSDIVYEPKLDTTYAIYTRYRVTGAYTPITQAYHFQVRDYKGKQTKEMLLEDAKKRSDEYITVISE